MTYIDSTLEYKLEYMDYAAYNLNRNEGIFFFLSFFVFLGVNDLPPTAPATDFLNRFFLFFFWVSLPRWVRMLDL